MKKEKNAAVKLSLLCHLVITVMMTFGAIGEITDFWTGKTEKYITFLQVISGGLQELMEKLDYFGINYDIESIAKILALLFVLTFVCVLLYNSKKGVFVSCVYLVGSIIAYIQMDKFIEDLERLPLIKRGTGASIMKISYLIMILLAFFLLLFSVYEQYLKKILTMNLQDSNAKKEVCPKCGKEVDISSSFCGSCGTLLSTICTECGEALSLGAKFCSHCGKMMETVKDESIKKEGTNRE